MALTWAQQNPYWEPGDSFEGTIGTPPALPKAWTDAAARSTRVLSSAPMTQGGGPLVIDLSSGVPQIPAAATVSPAAPSSRDAVYYAGTPNGAVLQASIGPGSNWKTPEAWSADLTQEGIPHSAPTSAGVAAANAAAPVKPPAVLVDPLTTVKPGVSVVRKPTVSAFQSFLGKVQAFVKTPEGLAIAGIVLVVIFSRK